MSHPDNITIFDKSHWNPCPFMALCSNTCISKRDTMLGTKRIELKQVQLPCQAKIHFLCHTLIMDNFFKNCTFNSFLRLLGPQIVPPTAPDWFESISRVQCKSRIKSWDDDVTTWSLKDHVVTLCLRTISVRSKSECIQKLIKHLYFVHLFRYPAKKNVKMLKNTIFCKWYQGVTFAI